MMYPGRFDRTLNYMAYTAVFLFSIVLGIILTNIVIDISMEETSKRYDITITNLASDKKIEYKNAGLSKGWGKFTVNNNGQDITYTYEGNSLSYEEIKQPETEKVKE